jgi:hypothetical protein
MWRCALAAALLCAITDTTSATVSEGGYEPEPWLEGFRQTKDVENVVPQEDADWEQAMELALEQREQGGQTVMDGPVLQDIVRQMQQYNQRLEDQDYKHPEDVEIELQEAPVAQAAKAKVAAQPKEEIPEVKNEVLEKQPLVAQKKGQSEYVSFVEPVEAKQTKSIPSVEKRRLTTSAEMSGAAPKYGSNLLMIAVGTVMCVGMIGTVAGGAMFLKRRRETPDDSEYAPYAGTGPGFKKSKKGEKGDETLAYKAQLHHYQQAKQKIICGDDAPGMVDSDGEDDGVDDENNFSVYECPGLAPTGDIEVVNPNFAAQP